MDNHFLRVPNDVIRSTKFNAKQICIQFLLNEVRGLSDKCLTSVGYLIHNCGYTTRRGKDGINNKYQDILSQMEINGLLILDKKYNVVEKSVSVNDLIVYWINADKFDCIDDFTQLTLNEFDVIIRNNNHRNKESLLHIYLYLKSYYHHQYTTLNRPLGSFQSLTTMSITTGMSPKTLIKLLNILVEQRLIIKHYVGSIAVNDTYKNVPNIYIPNLGQSQDEINETIKSTITLMKEFYKVDKFLPFMKNGKEN